MSASSTSTLQVTVNTLSASGGTGSEIRNIKKFLVHPFYNSATKVINQAVLKKLYSINWYLIIICSKTTSPWWLWVRQLPQSLRFSCRISPMLVILSKAYRLSSQDGEQHLQVHIYFTFSVRILLRQMNANNFKGGSVSSNLLKANVNVASNSLSVNNIREESVSLALFSVAHFTVAKWFVPQQQEKTLVKYIAKIFDTIFGNVF